MENLIFCAVLSKICLKKVCRRSIANSKLAALVGNLTKIMQSEKKINVTQFYSKLLAKCFRILALTFK